MKQTVRVFLNAKEEDEIRQGAPWVFDNEIAFIKIHTVKEDGSVSVEQKKMAECSIEPGTAVEVLSKGGLFLGTGIYNANSKITVRLLSRNHEPEGFNAAFFEQRIAQALETRKMYYGKGDSYRLVFGEADLLPGLIVDRFCDIKMRVFLVVQFLAMAAEKYRSEIISALETAAHPFGIYERSDASVREKEGLELKTGWIGAEHDPHIVIKENGVLINVDIADGQKTGYFLDQKYNRAAVSLLSKGKRVLDTFAHTGAFGLCCVKQGASEVTAVDISETAVEMINKNIELNEAGKVMHTVCEDVFKTLRRFEEEGRTFDMIILDPPAFTKSAKMIDKAYGGYKEINMRAMKLLVKGGILVTCSCSHFFDQNIFYAMVTNAASDAHRSVQILEKRGAGPDHPVLCGYPKSEYLTCAVAVVH